MPLSPSHGESLEPICSLWAAPRAPRQENRLLVAGVRCVVVLMRPLRENLSSLLGRRGIAVRYGAVSVINVVNHQILLNVANSGWGWGGGISNVFAAVVAAVPAYFLSRAWVWQVSGAHSWRDEVAPFWILALLGLLLSTALAEGADRTLGSGIWVALGSLLGYFILWVVKFFILDRLFDRSAKRLEASPR